MSSDVKYFLPREGRTGHGGGGNGDGGGGGSKTSLAAQKALWRGNLGVSLFRWWIGLFILGNSIYTGRLFGGGNRVNASFLFL
ncbi:hypothetical protein SCHPADRAFT_911734 [Schizopora paradoxa]|uniref:Uncharacterized protein n=1 Tax=Schizopora paradoxa TaxID=27342 RepID=A0A0H2R453_9AGAM|nr:hypothetical protein SCHPADRAFT_911734 [Schizopora paradoxa]